MGFVALGAWRARSAARAARSASLKAALSLALGLGPDDALTVNEIACADPACPDVETVVLVMRSGAPTRALRVPGPMAGVGPREIAALVEAAGTG